MEVEAVDEGIIEKLLVTEGEQSILVNFSYSNFIWWKKSNQKNAPYEILQEEIPIEAIPRWSCIKENAPQKSLLKKHISDQSFKKILIL